MVKYQVIELYEIDGLLSMLENPTRRRILQALVREPHYPFQLARELRVSQPAIVKHLHVLEDGGLVSSYEEASERGPIRRRYIPTSEFTIVMDMRSGMFSTRLIEYESVKKDHEDSPLNGKENASIEKTRAEIGKIDQSIIRLEQERSRMIDIRQEMIDDMLERLPAKEENYRLRILLHKLLLNPREDLDEISHRISIREEECEDMLQDLRKIIT